MRKLLHITSLLVGAVLCISAQAVTHGHLHAHEVRSPAGAPPNLKMDTELLRVRYDDDSDGQTDKHAGNGGWNGGSYEYKGNGRQGQSDITVTIDVTEIATEGMS